MKWTNIALLFLILLAGILIYRDWTRSQLLNQLTISQKKIQIDTLRIETEKKVVQFKEKKVVAEKIVDKWQNIHDTILFRDTLLVEAKNDIFSLDTALYSCELALGSCLNLKKVQSELIKSLENKKTPFIIPYAGIGLSADKDMNVKPSIQVGFGLNLNKIFGINKK